MTPGENHTVSGERVLELDALRGVAAIGVLLFHYTARYHTLFGHATAFRFSLPFGFLGVSLFFMISGFVILLTLDRCETVVDFAVARFARLYPVYWAATAATFVTLTVFGLPGWNVGFGSALVNLTMVHGFFGVPDVDGAYWSLGVELCFYTLMAILVAVGMRSRLVPILASLVLLDLIATMAGAASRIPGWWRVDGYLLGYLHLFLIGVVCYEMRAGFRRRQVLLLGLCVLDAWAHSVSQRAVYLSHANHLFGTPVIGVAFVLATQCRIRVLRHPVLVFLGTISYPLYLIHENIGYVVIRSLYAAGIDAYVAFGVAVAVAVALASCLAFSIERPANAHLRRAYAKCRGTFVPHHRLPRPDCCKHANNGRALD